MKIHDEALTTAANLSATAQRFLQFVEANPGCDWSFDRASADLPSWMAGYPYPLQAWPTFVGGRTLQEIQDLTVGMTRLTKSVLERVFNNDVRRIAQFYNVNEDLVAFLLAPPNGIEEGLARCDFMDTPQGFKCLEVNVGGFIGGWQLRFWERMYRKAPAVSRFLQQQGIDPRYRDPFRSLFEHLTRHAIQSGHCGGGTFNTMLVMAGEGLSFGMHAAPLLNVLYSGMLREMGLEGKLLVSSYSHPFVERQGALYANGGEKVQALVEYTYERTPHAVYRCFKAGMLSLYNGPLSGLLADKRNLALLSEHQDSDAFDPAERAILQKHLPWSRRLVRGKTSYQGEQVDLSALITEKQERFVIKLGVGARGESVLVGRFASAEEWKHKIQKVIDEGRWVAQEYVESRPYLYQNADSQQLHDVVWGTFCFGASYGGGFLRMIPSGKAGIINSARGATEGLFFEV